jgi:hypothetical protein
MYENRRKARDWLNDSTKSDFFQMLEKIKLSDSDIRILDSKFIHGKSNLQIAEYENCSIETVNRTIKKVYEKVARLLQ